MKEFKIKCYEYEELGVEAQQRAMTEIIQIILETIPFENQSVNIKKAINKADKMQTPWFTVGYVMDYAEEEVLLECSNSQFTKTGAIFPWYLVEEKDK
jgi:hypothetical protein